YGREVGHVPFRQVRCSPGTPRAGWHPEARREAAAALLAELEASHLSVGLFPTNDGRMARKATSRNADWYRRYMDDSPSDAAHSRTVTTRACTISALRRIADDKAVTELAELRLAPYLAEMEEQLKDEHVPF
ncbi:MAG: hypothetical protein KAI66_27710, partial [Lentisphaeria bacterium]|nr:hypothetical protein [Lentisphaeria bacterium]